MVDPNATLAPRLWSRVDRSGPLILDTPCWVWTGYVCPQTGYGKISNRPGPPIGTHVAAYLLEHGPVPAGLSVLHRCDHRPCVRHLYAGTQADNVTDMVDRGRQRPSGCRGEQIGTSRITEAVVAEVRRRLAAGSTGRAVARSLGLTDQHVSSIKRGRSWAWLS